MGLSSSPKSTSVSYSGSSNPQFVQPALNAASQVQGVYNANAGGLQGLTNLNNNTLVPQLLGQSTTAGHAANQGSGYYSDVLSGKYMNGNPFLDQILGQTREDIGNSVGGHFSQNGRYGSGANQGVMEKQMAAAENALRYQNYGDEMNRMGEAAQGAQQASTTDYAALLQALQQGAQMPYTGTESLANSLGALFNGGSDKSKSTGASPIWGAIGAAAGAAAAASDRRLKTNIVRIGDWDDKGDGLGKYRWNWKSDPNGKTEVGVIADEVKALRPHAYVPNFRGDGFDGVNYARLAA